MSEFDYTKKKIHVWINYKDTNFNEFSDQYRDVYYLQTFFHSFYEYRKWSYVIKDGKKKH